MHTLIKNMHSAGTAICICSYLAAYAPCSAIAWEDNTEEAQEEAAAAKEMQILEDTAADHGDAPPPQDIAAEKGSYPPYGAQLKDDTELTPGNPPSPGEPLIDDQATTRGAKTPAAEAPTEDTAADRGSTD